MGICKYRFVIFNVVDHNDSLRKDERTHIEWKTDYEVIITLFIIQSWVFKFICI